ncbi:aromatic ring-hydroxylating dioxygenase subunit alpha [Pseudolabrys taiwanensis]|uniref:Aromatic ring-hydroxylating dioxygenase subunit alpha n=1 Tax=Pseudolabrys taiwanensis TaxID=331696 RepID=A0A345ZWB5_9HYPH|nr:aromatic ring-hydroxylating dioxygenase subunit alpha [Pseudolabrys taiwanensis]AXK81212.1 aromatic ring-hydroxylating dioxygenase subunit alpha [Pseudolabrys taiwanensis]
MLTTQQKVLRRFWYAVIPVEDLKEGPKAFTLLGEDIVLFLGPDGKPAALKDRCCHRTAKLSKGWCKEGHIVCGYHGWEYDQTGKLAHVPQFPVQQEVPNLSTPAFHCQEKYGYVWVALDEPLAPIFDVAEDTDASFRRIPQFYEVWNTSALRLMENSFDNAHFAFVHKGTFGQLDQPLPEKYEIKETDYGFEAETLITVANPPIQYKISGTDAPTTKRHMRNKWYMPFCRRLDIEYPSGLRHIILNSATPIDDGHIMVVQWLYRNDTEADCPAQLLIDWDFKITREDKDIIESTDFDTPIDMGRRAEAHMVSDKPGMIMRKRLMDLLQKHGESEVFRAA